MTNCKCGGLIVPVFQSHEAACTKCGLVYSEQLPRISPPKWREKKKPRTPREKARFGKPSWNLEREPLPKFCLQCGQVWRKQWDPHHSHLVKMYCSNCRFSRYYKKTFDGGYRAVFCQSYIEAGIHPFRKTNVLGHDERRCIWCGKKENVSDGKYVTAQGIIEEYLSTGTVKNYDDKLPYGMFESLEYAQVTDPGYIESNKLTDRVKDVIIEASKARARRNLSQGQKERKRRYRKYLLAQKSYEVAQSRIPLIDKVVDTVRSYCKANNIQTLDENGLMDLEIRLGKVKHVLLFFDRLVLRCNRLKRGTEEIKVEHILTDKQLESLAAGATDFYLKPRPTQQEIAGGAESTFPNVTRPTLIDWKQYVKSLHSRLCSVRKSPIQRLHRSKRGLEAPSIVKKFHIQR